MAKQRSAVHKTVIAIIARLVALKPVLLTVSVGLVRIVQIRALGGRNALPQAV